MKTLACFAAAFAALIVASPAVAQTSVPTTTDSATILKRFEQLRARNQQLKVVDLTREIARFKDADQMVIARAVRIDPRIIGGNAIDIDSVPFQVALIRGYGAEPYRSQFCGGSLIAPDVVLTAAHCVDNGVVRKEAGRVHIVAGASIYRGGGERIEASAILIHPQWNPSNYDYDVAIIKLKAPSRLGKPVPIDASVLPAGARLQVSGWGATSEGGAGSDDLLAATVPLVDNPTCASDGGYGKGLTDRMMCAGYREGGVDSCQGDSGGPLVAGSQGSWRLVGVVSWGEGCARRLKYGIYTRLSEMQPWIGSVDGIRVTAGLDAIGGTGSTGAGR